MQPVAIRTFELIVSISGPLDVPMEDWPANVQDAIMAALERISQRERLPLKIVHAEYKRDPDIEPHMPGHHYLHVVASEIVMADSRYLDPRSVDNPTLLH